MTRTLLTAATVYSAYDEPPRRDAAVLVDNATVIAVDAASRFGDDLDAARVDLGDVVLGPGFIDGHVHLCFDASDDPVAHLIRASDDELVDTMRIALQEFLRAGVTTVRDLGARGEMGFALREQVKSAHTVAPQLLIAGRPLTTRGGHAWFFGGECADLSAMIATVEQHAAAGAEWIKVVVSGGFLTDGTVPAKPQFGADDLAETVRIAHSGGLRVAAHAHSTAAIDHAVRAHVDTIEHATFLHGSAARVPADLRARLLDSDVAVCPTANIATADYPPTSGVDALRRLAELHQAGLPLIAGTDAGVVHVRPGDYAAGLVALVAAGVSTRDVLAAATCDAATHLGLDRLVGRVAPGYRADVVALPVDPIIDIAAIAAPTFVMTNGHVAVQNSGALPH